jgi:predicted ATP-dependent endonuclease of OLD family
MTNDVLNFKIKIIIFTEIKYVPIFLTKMILKEIVIKNFRSIADLSIHVKNIGNSNTYTLIGINESGKSNILKVINLHYDGNAIFPQDFHDSGVPITIELKYFFTPIYLQLFKLSLQKEYNFPEEILQKIQFDEVVFSSTHINKLPSEEVVERRINLEETNFKGYYHDSDEKAIKIDENRNFDFDDFLSANYSDYFWEKVHKITFWQSTPQYLISDEIDLTQFSDSPNTVSIPLANCFKLSGLDIKEEIKKLTDPSAIQNLEDILSDKVSLHINKVWAEHPISIKFKINNMKISFLIVDNDVKYKSKTTGQRSDGFRQFVSFLLTISAENQADEFRNNILLLDEPETHLHPTAQINLKNELIKITQNDKNNIVFFATHSNYMIDKENIDRCYRVIKEGNDKTCLKQIAKSNSSYSEVNFEVFDIITNDYHNELYGYLEDVKKPELEALVKSKKWFNERKKKEEDVSLATYIRHSIHHPENTSNSKFTEDELKESIKILRELKYKI